MTEATSQPRATLLGAFRRLMPTVLHYRWRVFAALAFLIAGKLANIGVPLVLKHLVDGLDVKPSPLVDPVPAADGVRRAAAVDFTVPGVAQVVFARVLARTSREITLRVFSHLHAPRCVSISTGAPAASRAMSSAA